MKSIIRGVYGEVFCHETEDIEKVMKGFEIFFPKKNIKKKVQKGVYGTNITIITSKLKNKSAKILFDKIFKNISTFEIERILKNPKKWLDEDGKFYLNLNKQKANKKEIIELCEYEDSIKIVFSIQSYPANYNSLTKTLSELLKSYM